MILTASTAPLKVVVKNFRVDYNDLEGLQTIYAKGGGRGLWPLWSISQKSSWESSAEFSLHQGALTRILSPINSSKDLSPSGLYVLYVPPRGYVGTIRTLP